MDHTLGLPTDAAVGSILFCCPDKSGLIAALAKFFAVRGLNISRFTEFTDNHQFVSRFEWVLDARWESETEFCGDFDVLANGFGADYQVLFHNRQQTIGLFASTQTHVLIELLNKQEANHFPNTEIAFIVGSDQSIRTLADRHGVPFFYVETSGDPLDYEARQLEIVHRYKPDVLGLASYANVLSARFVDRVGGPIINIGCSFLPSLAGADPYQIAYNQGLKLIGATARFVTAAVDQGPIIEQDVVRVKTAASVHDMIELGRAIEQKVFTRAMLTVLEHKALVYENRTIVFD